MAHPKPEDLDRWLRSLAVSAEPALLEHVLECPSCRERALAELRARAEPAPASPALRAADVLPYPPTGARPEREACETSLSSRLRRLSAATLARAQEEQQAAHRLLDELMALPATRQELRVRNGDRFRSPILAQRILERSREAGFDDPVEAERLARLALAVVQTADRAVYGSRLLADLEARAWSHVGNALRQQEDLEGAEAAFREGAQRLAGTADPLEEAGFFHRLAALRRMQLRFEESRRLLRRAGTLYRDAGDPAKLAQVLTSLSNEFLDEGDGEGALEPLFEARRLVDPESDPRTALYILHNLTLALLETGRVLEAQRTHRSTRPLYRRFPDRMTQLHRRWLEGQLAAGTGRAADGERLLREVQAAYSESGQPEQAAAVSLDLARLYAQQGRTEDLRRVVDDLTRSFHDTPLHQAARTALALLARTVRQEDVAREVVMRMVQRTAVALKRPQRHGT